MEIIRAIRNLRAEMNVAPGKKATLILRPREGWKDALIAADGYFKRLAGASAVEMITADDPNPAKSASAVAESCELYIPLGELVDIEKELARLDKDLKNAEGEVKRAHGMLNNEKFVSKAPAHLVEAEKEKLVAAQSKVDLLKARITEMEALR